MDEFALFVRAKAAYFGRRLYGLPVATGLAVNLDWRLKCEAVRGHGMTDMHFHIGVQMTSVGTSRRALLLGTVVCAASVFFAIACTDDAVTGPGFICDVSNPVSEVVFDSIPSVLLVHSPARASDTAIVVAHALNRVGTTRTDVPINFASSDTSIASIDKSGIVRAHKPGSVRITASTCGESRSVNVTVSLFATSVQVRFDTTAIVGADSVLVRARALAQGSSASIPGAKFTFSISNVAGVTLSQRSDSTAMVKTAGTSSGTVTVTATGEGASGNTSLIVLPRVFVGSLTASDAGMDVGRDFGCGLISLGRLYCWGVNVSSQLGAATDSVCFEEGGVAPVASPCSLIPIRVAPQLSFSSVSAGDGFACGLIANGKAYCWGEGTNGKLGNGSNGGASAPTAITFGSSFASISAGGNHACGIIAGGAAYCWGQDSAGQLGDARFVNSTTPIPVFAGGSIPTFSSISAGFRHTCALDGGGFATCWGLNDNGQLGAGVLGGLSDQPLTVAGGKAFKAISAGGDTVQTPFFPFVHYESHTCAIATNGAAYCWGSNASGQLGNGTVGGPDVAVPTPVGGGLTFAKISAGSRFTCGLTTAGAIYCWGHNADLQLGRGPATNTNSDSGVPAIVSGGQLPAGVTFVSVSAGRRHACGVGSDGAAYCWGSDVFGALGNTLQAAFRGFPQKVATPQ